MRGGRIASILEHKEKTKGLQFPSSSPRFQSTDSAPDLKFALVEVTQEKTQRGVCVCALFRKGQNGKSRLCVCGRRVTTVWGSWPWLLEHQETLKDDG